MQIVFLMALPPFMMVKKSPLSTLIIAYAVIGCQDARAKGRHAVESSAFRGKILRSLRSLRMTVCGGQNDSM